MKQLIIIPTYNEKSNIGRLVRIIINLNLSLNILVIDDNSPDGTGKLIDALAEKYPQVKAMHRKGKLGLGTAYIQGFKYALDKGYDYIFTMDADFSHNPKYLQIFLNNLKEYDFVIGSRYVPNGGVLGCPLQRRLLSRLSNLYARTITGLKIKDSTSGFTGIKSEAIRSLALDEINSKGYGFLIEYKYLVVKNGFKFREIPIIFTDRVNGKSKIARKTIFKAFVLVWRIRLGR